MQPSEFKDALISFCEVGKLNYTIKDNELSVTMTDAINQASLSNLCDSWYSDHKNQTMVFKFNTGLVYKITRAEHAVYNEMIKGMSNAESIARYGVRSISKKSDGKYMTFVSAEDTLNMSFLLIDNMMEFDNDEAEL